MKKIVMLMIKSDVGGLYDGQIYPLIGANENATTESSGGIGPIATTPYNRGYIVLGYEA